MGLEKNTKIRVVFATPSFIVGGIENHLAQQLYIFDKNIFDLYLITLFQYKNRENFYDKLPKDVTVFKFNFRNFFDIINFIKLIKTLIKIKPDIVVSSMFSANSLFRILSIFLGYKSIAREHNTYTEKKRWQFLLDGILSNLSYKIVAVSKTVMEFSSKNSSIPSSRFLVINNGVDLNKISSFISGNDRLSILKELRLDKNRKYILNVARLKAQKNQKLLIDSFFEFSKSNPEYSLVILGDGAEKENLKNRIKELDLENKVLLLGFRSDVFKYYLISDFFVLTSKIEGFPNVCLEALAFGLPILTTKVSGTDELITPKVNGLFIEDNVLSVCNGLSEIKKLLSENEKVIRNNCKSVVGEFDIKENVKAYEKLLIDCVKK